MSARNLNPALFGTLYHGTDKPGLAELDQSSAGGPRYRGMRNSYGYNYATNDLSTAINYARAAARDTGGAPTVYEVEPKLRSKPWGPDPDSGPNGWNDGPRSKREALELHENGSEVSLRFKSPLRTKREVFVEDKAKDITGTKMGWHEDAYGPHPGRSFS